MGAFSHHLAPPLTPWRDGGLRLLFQDDPATDWPQPWRDWFSKLNPQSATVWTYWQLGLDFGGKASAQRRASLGKLISALAWPKGSVTFWPFCALYVDSPCLLPQPDLFWRGVGRTNSRLAVSFGRRAGEALACSAADMGYNHTLVALPALSAIAHSSEAFDQALNQLREAYASITP